MEMSFYSRADLLLTPSLAVTCDTSAGYVGATRVGLNVNPSSTQLNSIPLGEYASLFRQNFTDLAFTVESWVRFDGGGTAGTSGIFGVTSGGTPVFQVSVDNRIRTSFVTGGGDYAIITPACFVSSDIPYEFYYKYRGVYHVTVTFRVVGEMSGDFNYNSTSTYTRDGYTERCLKRGGFFVYEELPGGLFFEGGDRIKVGNGLNGTVLFTALYNRDLSNDEVDQLIAAGPPNSIPVAARNVSLTVYEDFVSLLNLTQVGYYDADGDNVTYLRILSLPVGGNVTYLNGSLVVAPVTLALGVNLAYTPETGDFGCIAGLSVAFSDDGSRFSPEPAAVWVCIDEVNDPPEPIVLTQPLVLKGQTVIFALQFIDLDDDKFDVNGIAQAAGVMMDVESSRLRDGARIRFHETTQPQGFLMDATCTANLTAGEDVPYYSGVSQDSFSFCFRSTSVGLANFTYQFTDPANLTGSNATVTLGSLPALISCPASPLTRPLSFSACVSHDTFVYLEGRDANYPLATVLFRILTLPAHGELFINGPSPSPLSAGDEFASALVPNVLFAPEVDFYSARGESPNFVYDDLNGDPLAPPDRFTYQVIRGGEADSLVYTYLLHVLVTHREVNVTSGLREVEEGAVPFRVSSPTTDALLLGVKIEVTSGFIRLVAPWYAYRGVFWGAGCEGGNVGRFSCQYMTFATQESRMNEILATLEYKQPASGVRNGTGLLTVTVFAADPTGAFSAYSDDPIGEGSVRLVGDRVTGSTASLVAQLSAVIIGSIVSGVLAFGLCFMYVGVILLCRVS
jgi:hypothetical protein